MGGIVQYYFPVLAGALGISASPKWEEERDGERIARFTKHESEVYDLQLGPQLTTLISCFSNNFYDK